MSKRRSVGLIYFVVIILTLLMRVASALDVYSALGIEDADVLWTCVIQILIFGVTPVVLYAWGARARKESAKQVLSDFGAKRINVIDWLIILGVCVCVIVVSSGISFSWQFTLRMMGFTHIPSSTDYPDVSSLFKDLALTALLPGIFEEISHRGLLYAGYKETRRKYVVLSALLFSLMHQNIVQTGYTFFFGVVLGLLVYYTGSIWGGVFIHFVNNAYSVLSGYADQHIDGALGFIAKAENWFYSSMLGLATGAILVIACAGLLILLLWLMRKRALKAQRISAQIEIQTKDSLPLWKDWPIWVVVAIGVVATIFSFVWGMTR